MKRYACLFSDGSMNVHPDRVRKGKIIKTGLQSSIEERDEWNETDEGKPAFKEKDRARVVTFDLPDSAIEEVK